MRGPDKVKWVLKGTGEKAGGGGEEGEEVGVGGRLGHLKEG